MPLSISWGCLQGEGRTFLFGMSNVICLFLDMCVFNPIFLFGFKTGIIGTFSATVISEFIPGITILILFYCHEFGIKPFRIESVIEKVQSKHMACLKSWHKFTHCTVVNMHSIHHGKKVHWNGL